MGFNGEFYSRADSSRPRRKVYASEKKSFIENINALLHPNRRSELIQHYENVNHGGLYHVSDEDYLTWAWGQSPHPLVGRELSLIITAIISIIGRRGITDDILSFRYSSHYNYYYNKLNSAVTVFDIIDTLRLFKSLGLYGTCEYLNKVFKFNNQSMKKAI